MKNKNQKTNHRINDSITSIDIRLVGDNVKNGIYSFRYSLDLAKNMGLDLVEINPNMSPPVCKLLDYNKFLYEQKKKQKKLKQNQVKEIRFGPQIYEHDYEFKKNNARKFLQEGSKVRLIVFFKGRSIIYKNQGEVLLFRLARDLEDCSKTERMPYLEGKRMFLVLNPKIR